MRRIRLLQIEDNEDDALLVLNELRRGGFDTIVECIDTAGAMEAALKRHKWDIIISDYSLPRFSGLDALAVLKRHNIDVPFILVSGTIGEVTAVAGMKAGAQDYIMKNNLSRLVPAVERELQEAEVRRQRKQSEEKLRQSEDQFRLIMENVADLIAVLDLKGKRLYNSPSYKNVLGDPEELLGTDSFMEIHPEDRGKVKQIFQETLRTGVGQRTEYRFLLNDKSIRHIESQGSVIRDRNGNVTNVVVVSRDVTERKNLEAQFLRVQRMESIGTLAGGIAHDLNNVLAPIMLSIQILKKKYSIEADQKLLEALESSAKRGIGMVKQVLTFARGVEGERVPLQIKHLVSEMEKIMRETFPRSIHALTKIAKEPWTISGDATQLHQVLMNLCVNARDAMPNGGTLTIEIENTGIDEQYVRMHPEARPGPYTLLTVHDTGTGMPPEILDKIFEPFFTTKEIGKGTGLGLSTVLGIVKNHRGFINVYSEVGHGTKFHIYLPAVETPSMQIDKNRGPDLPQGDGELILLVDDEASIIEIGKATLQSYGYRTLTASDGAEAVAIYAQNQKEIAAVITDMMMPFMDGAATIRAIRKINPNVRVIATSGLGQANRFPEKNGPERIAFLQKPYTAELLLITLHEILQNIDS